MKNVFIVFFKVVTLHVSVWVEIARGERRSRFPSVTLHVSVWVEMFLNLIPLLTRLVTLHVSVWVEIHCKIMVSALSTVTLHVSVWVEMIVFYHNFIRFVSHAPRERVSWNDFAYCVSQKVFSHAPRERVSWNAHVNDIFEILRCHAPRERVSWNPCWTADYRQTTLSRSTWACELKFCVRCVRWNLWSHAPRERVSWNFFEIMITLSKISHAPRERVSWNDEQKDKVKDNTCHAPRERVSWNRRILSPLCLPIPSRSTWACELKFRTPGFIAAKTSHAPRERVSWNRGVFGRITWIFLVTLHVSVWVEIFVKQKTNVFLIKSRSTWACELKLSKLINELKQMLSRSTWACELK